MPHDRIVAQPGLITDAVRIEYSQRMTAVSAELFARTAGKTMPVRALRDEQEFVAKGERKPDDVRIYSGLPYNKTGGKDDDTLRDEYSVRAATTLDEILSALHTDREFDIAGQHYHLNGPHKSRKPKKAKPDAGPPVA